MKITKQERSVINLFCMTSFGLLKEEKCSHEANITSSTNSFLHRMWIRGLGRQRLKYSDIGDFLGRRDIGVCQLLMVYSQE